MCEKKLNLLSNVFQNLLFIQNFIHLMRKIIVLFLLLFEFCDKKGVFIIKLSCLSIYIKLHEIYQAIALKFEMIKLKNNFQT